MSVAHLTFEYRVIAVTTSGYANFEDLLNRYGAEGFSVVVSIPGFVVLQRTVRT